MDVVPAAIDDALRRTIDNGGRVCVLTGAGMSAESGIPTFRGTHDSLWSRFDPMQLATAEAWCADPALVWGWYRWRMQLVRDAQPNAGHVALADLARRVPLSLVTQNVDDLHERAGSIVDAHLQVVAHALDAHVLGGQLGAFVEQLDAAAAWVVKEVDNLGVEHLGAGLGGAAVKLDDVFGFHDFFCFK